MTKILSQKTVLITGASSGIGAACARKFAAQGARLLLCARRLERLQQLKEILQRQYQVDVHCFVLDVRDQQQVERTLADLPPEWQAIDILVNNAGMARGLTKFHEGRIEDWQETIETNLHGLLYVTRQVLPGMVERKCGQIINVGSIAGHAGYPGGNIYCATKFAVRGLTQSLRMDLLGTPIRVNLISPGMVETEFSNVRFSGDAERAKKVYQGLQPLVADDIADAVVYCATCPPHVNIDEIILMPVAQVSATMVSREMQVGLSAQRETQQ